MSCCACTQSADTPFELTLPLGSAPQWPFELSDPNEELPDPDADEPILLSAFWFAVKSAPTDADADALIFASTANGKGVITDAANWHGQVNLTAADSSETDTLLPDRTYYAFYKAQFSTGETRVRAGYVHTLPGGIEAPE